ncbi:MAG: YjhG/YagF family D-xylonate dehydratase [Roseibacillus sp.]|jgi:putative YjhG/YagF family dehydratase|nr:YjhG/YagF family D-xylonate dehydratase [Roseibacillus sp.]MCP4731866.1 YjhG/YagF family D-xylonate dehydratase [Roseibacillus sp.]MDP7105685.1 YjhG/YagF family D-xylonate dehydratase [Roseibacillus sp.]MDP7309413.1 YjhG/YagF family D-xylonate dehydratase [Roseibacillus sp.]HJM64854.1 YjhG/YagF family D-xylonate dehydratase [Roseibacillus sp.]|tara:strand:+ start:9726 stop:11630 length:1905 start_codon:yes stop_codon:yes gene_type:complete
MPNPILDSASADIFTIRTTASGPTGSLPFTGSFLQDSPSGDVFGWTQDAGMGWDPSELGSPEFLMLSTSGGIRNPDGTPVALGLHTGHWEVSLLMEEAAGVFKANGAVPFAVFCSDPCDGRSQGTTGMFDSLAYRNDAATVLRRLTRSLPTARGMMGVATCDKGLPAMMMALAGNGHLPGILVPGGVTLLSEEGEDLAKVQSVGARFAHNEIELQTASETACRSCGSPGGGCQFLGTAATTQVVAEALGMTLPHTALAPSGSDAWRDMARRSALALMEMTRNGIPLSSILTEASLHNALVLHAAFGGSTNLILHIPAIAHAAGLPRPDVDDWQRINRKVPRLVDALPNGPHGYATVQVFLAGGVPEVMLHLRDHGLLELDAPTVSGLTIGENLTWWEQSERRRLFRDKLTTLDGIDPHDVIRPPENSFSSTVTFIRGNLVPDGAVVKSTAIAPDLLDGDGVFLHEGPARVFVSEEAAIAALKSTDGDRVQEGEVLVLAGLGPVGAGMPETYQVTSALRYASVGKNLAVLTDGRFSGVSTGPCLGHASPEALAGGPLGKLRDGDPIRIHIDTRKLVGTADFVGDLDEFLARPAHPDLAPDPRLPADTRLWAALQNASGGSWGGCVYDVDEIIKRL